MFEEIKKEILKFISETVEYQFDDINIGNKIETYEIDSILFIKMILMLENKFHITFEEEYFVAEQFESIAAIIEYVEILLREKGE